ncbi:MAG: YncE family protein, partial [Planctomycetales bacterium]
MVRRAAALVLGITLGVFAGEPAWSQTPPGQRPQFAGQQPGDEGFLLPNGWRLTPAGRHVTLTDLPLNILVSNDGKQAIVSTSGYNAHELTIVDLESGKKIAKETVKQSWFGLAADDDRQRLWWSAGGEG